MNYYERHIGDYLKDTSHLSLLEHGVYSRLLDVYFTREDGIPEKEAARLIGARSKDEREALQSVLGEFFELVDGLFRQARADREIARFQAKSNKAKASAQARWAHSDRNANADANASADAMRTHTEGNALQSPVTRHQSTAFPPSSIAVDPPTDPPPPLPTTSQSVQGRALDLVVMLKARGCRINASNPYALEWATNGVTDAQLLTALDRAEEARQAKADPNPINAGYLNAIVKDVAGKTPQYDFQALAKL